MNHKRGSGGWALLASAQSLSAESGNRSGAGAKAAARRKWDDLKHTTKKQFRNQKKKAKKKSSQGPILRIKRGPVLVHF